MKKQWEAPELEEMPVVILSLHQKWWQKMAAGEKVLELRKTKPQCKAPFRVLVYVTGGAGVLGEFICPEVLEIKNFEEAEKKSKVPAHDIHNYAAGSRNKEYARKLTRAAINNGFVPVTVHLYLTEVTDDQNPEERSRGMAAGMKILENCKYILIGNKYGISDGMKAEMTLAALKGKVMLYEQDGKIYLVDSREETTGGQDNE